MKSRSTKEIATDILLLLYLIREANQRGSVSGITKLQKLIFLTQYAMVEEGVRGFNYKFFRWHYGPFSTELTKDFEKLFDSEILTEEGKVKLTKRGKEILKECEDLLEKNGEILSFIDKTIKEHGRKRLERIKSIVYNMKVPTPKLGEKKIEDLPKRINLLSKLPVEGKEVQKQFKLSKEWVASLDILMNKDLYESLKETNKTKKPSSGIRVSKWKNDSF